MTIGIVLFAHGSRDPLWCQPIEAIARAAATASPTCHVRCAYLELMEPTLEMVVAELIACGVTKIRIAPMFLGIGKHARDDLPKIVGALEKNHPQLIFDLMPAIGEHPLLMTTIADILTKRL